MFLALDVDRDISNAPQNVTNTKGLILLRKSGVTTPRKSAFALSWHAVWVVQLFESRAITDAAATVILQNNFNIFDGFVEVTVPLLVEASDYSIIRACLCLLSRHLCAPETGR